LKVLLLEKTQFPRHHVGESLLAGGTPVLSEMGVYDKVNNYGFVEKLGATYVWGQNRSPWGFEFREVVKKLETENRPLPDLYTKAWQVRRAEYDFLLLEHAAEVGVEVLQGARVHRVLWDKELARAVGVEYSQDGRTSTIKSTWLMDCTGQDALIGREMKLRRYDKQMNNYALWGYWKGAQWKYQYLGHPDKTRILIATTPHGWLWYIPVSGDIVSVGLVTHRQTLRNRFQKIEQLYRSEIAACDEVIDLLRDAHLVRIAPDQTRDICAIQDWSYTSSQMAGAGWAMAGDAAGFVDPILSSGVMLAQELGQKAAYTINSSFATSSDEQIREYWNFYNDTYHTYLQAYRDMAGFWYSNNFSMETWWWQAQRILAQQSNAVNLTQRDAYTRIAFGYATRAESLSLFGSYPLNEAQQLVDGLFGASTSVDDTTALSAAYANRFLRLKEDTQITDGMYYYQGQIQTTRRVVTGSKRYLDLRPEEEVLLNLFDGEHTLADLNEIGAALRILNKTTPMKIRVRTGVDLLVQLDDIGALA
jgi:clorobiocin biosynthesis protein Clo-hal